MSSQRRQAIRRALMLLCAGIEPRVEAATYAEMLATLENQLAALEPNQPLFEKCHLQTMARHRNLSNQASAQNQAQQ